MKSQYDYELIRDYLHGLADSKTAREVGDLIRRDEIARSIAEGILRLDENFQGNEEAIESYLEKIYQSQLHTIHKHTQPAGLLQRYWLRIAASLLILVAAGVAIWTQLSEPGMDSLIAQELSVPYPASNLFRSETAPTIEDQGYVAYEAGRYDEATRYFDLALAADNSKVRDASIYFYNALSQLYAGNYARATELLESPAIAESRYLQQARWYMGLALLRLNNRAAAIEVLSEIRKDPRSFKYEAAGELLSQLE